MSVTIVGCQLKRISKQLKQILVKKVQEMCQESPQLCRVVITVKFVSNAHLKADILELLHHLYNTASAVELSLGQNVVLMYIFIVIMWHEPVRVQS